MMQSMDRNEAILRIRAALKRRSGKAWSVKGGTGTAWSWIKIDAPPARQTWVYVLPPGAPDVPESYVEEDGREPGRGHMSPAERKELAALLGLERVHFQGESVPASTRHRWEYVDRAEGRAPRVIGEQYWD